MEEKNEFMGFSNSTWKVIGLLVLVAVIPPLAPAVISVNLIERPAPVFMMPVPPAPVYLVKLSFIA